MWLNDLKYDWKIYYIQTNKHNNDRLLWDLWRIWIAWHMTTSVVYKQDGLDSLQEVIKNEICATTGDLTISIFLCLERRVQSY